MSFKRHKLLARIWVVSLGIAYYILFFVLMMAMGKMFDALGGESFDRQGYWVNLVVSAVLLGVLVVGAVIAWDKVLFNKTRKELLDLYMMYIDHKAGRKSKLVSVSECLDIYREKAGLSGEIGVVVIQITILDEDEPEMLRITSTDSDLRVVVYRPAVFDDDAEDIDGMWVAVARIGRHDSLRILNTILSRQRLPKKSYARATSK